MRAAGDNDNGNDGKNQCSSFKVVLLGDSGIGKTWLVEQVLARQAQQAQSDAPVPSESRTIGVTFNLTKLQLANGQTALLHLWDTSGQERYRNLVANYIGGADCVLLAYDPSLGREAARRALSDWRAFADPESRSHHRSSSRCRHNQRAPFYAVVAVSLTCDCCSRQQQQQQQQLQHGRWRSSQAAAEAAECLAGANFGRVFASSLCGAFFQFHRHRRRHQPTLTARSLAELLLARRQAEGQAEEQRQQQLLPAARDEADDNFGDGGGGGVCLWCQRLLWCRRSVRRYGSSSSSRG